MLAEREFELINIIGAKLGSNQRDLSRLLDLSLGQTNMLIRRLISKGYIRISQLNKRKVQYFLTPKGFAEKMRKSVNYTLKTVNSISLINKTLKEMLTDLSFNSAKQFYIIGKSDFAFLVEEKLKIVYKEVSEIFHLRDVPHQKVNGILLICKEVENIERNVNCGNCFNIIEELAKRENFLNGIVK